MDRKQRRTLHRHRFLWRLLQGPIRLIMRLHYGPMRMERAPELEGAYIVLPNHTCGGDQFFVAVAFPRKQMYFVASEHAFRKKLMGALMRWVFGPIPRAKGTLAAGTTKTLLRWLKEGVPICIFPEGNRTWDGRTGPLHPTTAKLLRVAGVPVMTYRIEGGYLSDPRWSKSLRRGKIHGETVNVYSPEELKKMSPEEISARIAEDLWVDAAAGQEKEPVSFRGKRMAEGLEEALFLCPSCGGLGTLRGEGNDFCCTCGLRATYDEFGFLHGDAPFRTVAAWNDWQLRRLPALAAQGITLSDEGAELWKIHEGFREELLAEGRVTLDSAGLRLGPVSFPLGDMGDAELCHLAGRETMVFTVPEGNIELRFRGSPSRRKYQLLLKEFKALGTE